MDSVCQCFETHHTLRFLSSTPGPPPKVAQAKTGGRVRTLCSVSRQYGRDSWNIRGFVGHQRCKWSDVDVLPAKDWALLDKGLCQEMDWALFFSCIQILPHFVRKSMLCYNVVGLETLF